MLGKWIISLLMRLGVWGVLLFQLFGFYRYRFGAQFNVAFAGLGSWGVPQKAEGSRVSDAACYEMHGE